MTTTEEKIVIMQAHWEGEIIEKSYMGGIWSEDERPTWNWEGCDYRIKAKKPREWWVNEYNNPKRFGEMFKSPTVADDMASEGSVLIHVREVIGED